MSTQTSGTAVINIYSKCWSSVTYNPDLPNLVSVWMSGIYCRHFLVQILYVHRFSLTSFLLLPKLFSMTMVSAAM